MPLETANYIYDLVQANPPDTDLVQQGDDHLRLIKKVMQQTWPNITGPNLPTSTGAANAQVVTHVYGPAAYSAGQMVTFKAGFTNTGPTTINVNGGGVTTLAQGGVAMAGGEVVTGRVYTAIYDPAITAFNIIGGTGSFLPLVGGALTGWLTIGPISGTAQLSLNKSGSGAANNVYGYTAGVARWQVNFGNAAAESGSNAGSDFVISRFTDAGVLIDTPLSITRSTGNILLSGALSIAPASATPVLVLNKPSAAQDCQIIGRTGGNNRWLVSLGDATAESGGNVGSNFDILRFNDAGTLIDVPFAITRSTGVATFGQIVQARAYQCRAGMNGVYGPNAFGFAWATPNFTLWIDATSIGNITYSSDYRIKRDIEPLPSVWERVKALKPISFKHKEYTPLGAEEPLFKTDDTEHWGFIAHELQETLIEDAASGHKDEDNVIQSPNLMVVIATLTKALQEAMERIEHLEEQLGVSHA